jgi:hypothetical protein
VKKLLTLGALLISLVFFPVSAHTLTISFAQPESIYRVLFEESENCQADSHIACDVLDYLRSHPDASDSIQDVAASWVEVDDLSVSIEDVDGVSTFSLDRETGEIRFGDGTSGARTPSGNSVTIGTYTYGGGSEGNVSTVNIYYFPAEFYPFIIPQDVFPQDNNGATIYEFILSGIVSLEYEIMDGDLYITEADYLSSSVPEPSTMLLLCGGLLGLGAFRKKFKK